MYKTFKLTVCTLTSKNGLISSKVLVMVAASTEGAMATTRSIIDSLRGRRGQKSDDTHIFSHTEYSGVINRYSCPTV